MRQGDTGRVEDELAVRCGATQVLVGAAGVGERVAAAVDRPQPTAGEQVEQLVHGRAQPAGQPQRVHRARSR